MPRFYKGKSRKNPHAPKKQKRTLREKARFAWRMIKLLAVVSLIGIVALAFHIRSVDRMIEEKFDKPRKWNLPSRIYSDAEYIFPGMAIDVPRMISKLDRLGYRNMGQEIRSPGDYSSDKGRLDIFLHDFSYPFENFKGFPVRILISDGKIASLVNLTTSEGAELVKLEPEEIASILDVSMENRTLITLDQVPPQLVEAIILIEDERFFKHKGVDPWGIVRAMAVNISKLRIAQGGSTLTQQLVKNYFLYPKKSILRKLNEALIALRIEKHHTKKEILQAYLNEIYLGQRGASSIAGVGEAAKFYFAKDVSQLDIAECATIAGMIKSPNQFSPLSHPDKAIERRNFVLSKMLEAELITKDDYEQAKAEPIITPKLSMQAVRAPYFIDFVKQQLASLYPQEVLESEGLKIFTTLDMTLQGQAEKSLSEGLSNLEKTYAASLPKDHADPLQGALIAIQPSNGYVRALVGGRSYADSQFNRATQAKRQPGSTFKPFVYLTAFDPKRSKTLLTVATIVDDAPFSVKSGGKEWSPKNYDKKGHGLVSLRQALYNSYNIATAKVAIEAGLDNIVKTGRDAGIASDLEAVPSMALGSFELTPLEMATAYTIFPNSGMRAEALSIINVMTKDGQVLEKKGLNISRAFDDGPIYLTTNVMKDVLDKGTGKGARSLGFTGIAAGKTGTTSSYRDAWFVGFTPNLLALVWVGYDDNATTNMSGGRAALPIWAQFMKAAQPDSSQDFPSPPNVILVKINPQTGLLPKNSCPDIEYEPFIEGTEPETTCDEFVPPTNFKPEF